MLFIGLKLIFKIDSVWCIYHNDVYSLYVLIFSLKILSFRQNFNLCVLFGRQALLRYPGRTIVWFIKCSSTCLTHKRYKGLGSLSLSLFVSCKCYNSLYFSCFDKCIDTFIDVLCSKQLSTSQRKITTTNSSFLWLIHTGKNDGESDNNGLQVYQC